MQLQAGSGIHDLSLGPAHERMSVCHISASDGSCYLGRLGAVHPVDGNVRLWIGAAQGPLWQHLCSPGLGPPSGLSKGLGGSDAQENQSLELPEADQSVVCSPGHWDWECVL